MRTFKVAVIAAVFGVASLVATIAVGSDSAPPYASATDAYRQGIATLKTGDTIKALPPLEYASDQGVLGAQLKLARIYAAGNGVKADETKALYYYRQIANQRADISPSSPIAKYVAEAFVALGKYNLQGVKGADLRPDPDYAANLFRHAASYFGDADAQYELAKLYLSGVGVEKNTGLAVNWLATAARKQQPEAQASLGELLWQAGGARRARGLGLIMLGHANASADGKEPQWIQDLYRKTLATADAGLQKEARSLIPELGGTAIAVDQEMVPATTEHATDTAAPLMAPSATAQALTAAPAPAAPRSPTQLGVPVGFGLPPSP